MKRVFKIGGYSLAALAGLAAIGWIAIGPQWRMFLKNPPLDNKVLFWTQEQRDSGFALSDKLPIISSEVIKAGESIRELPIGPPLPLDFDIDRYMIDQNSAAIVVLHKGAVRLERYGLHQTAASRWTSFSVAKSFTSTLIGIAIADGDIASLDDKVSDYVPGLKGSAYDDVNIQQLLTMTSGVDWNENYADPESDVAKFSQVEIVEGEPATVTYMKRLPRAHPAGVKFNYSTGETNLVGILLEAATGATLSNYLSDKIWKPFGMQQDASWVISKTGEAISGCCLQAVARDYARFGQFILENGEINGKSILPTDWLSEATRVQQKVPYDPRRDYGYQWWPMDNGAFTAGGIFGQGIFIDPKRELIIVTHSSWRDARGAETGQSDARYTFYELVRQAIDAEAK